MCSSPPITFRAAGVCVLVTSDGKPLSYSSVWDPPDFWPTRVRVCHPSSKNDLGVGGLGLELSVSASQTQGAEGQGATDH